MNSSLSVLIVDDEPEICSLLQDTLIKKGYEIAVSTSYNDALSAIDNNSFDIIVTDLILRPASGLDILKRAKEKDPHCEVLVVTGHPTLDSAVEAVNQGAISYLMKPISIFDFIAQIERAAAQRKFHLRSLSLLNNVYETDLKQHVKDVVSGYELAIDLSKTLDAGNIIKYALNKVRGDLHVPAALIFVCYKNNAEIHISVAGGMASAGEMRSVISDVCKRWNELNRHSAVDENSVQVIFDNSVGDIGINAAKNMLYVPMMVTGRLIGFLYAISENTFTNEESARNYLHIISNLAAPVIENAYLHLRTEIMARTDGLTEINNHRSFQEHLERELKRAIRHKRPLSLAMLDIDDFKKVNDAYGHQTGDEILRSMTALIKKEIRATDIFSRYGGEEFTIIFPESSAGGVGDMVERIRELVSENVFDAGKNKIKITISIGVSCFDGGGSIAKDELIWKADSAMYKAKADGKNCVRTA